MVQQQYLFPVDSKEDWNYLEYPTMNLDVNDISGTNYYMRAGMVAYDIYEKCQEQLDYTYEECIERIADPYFLPFYDGWVSIFNMYQQYFYFQDEVANFGACHAEYQYCFFMYAFEANSQIYYYAQYFEQTQIT